MLEALQQDPSSFSFPPAAKVLLLHRGRQQERAEIIGRRSNRERIPGSAQDDCSASGNAESPLQWELESTPPGAFAQSDTAMWLEHSSCNHRRRQPSPRTNIVARAYTQVSLDERVGHSRRSTHNLVGAAGCRADRKARHSKYGAPIRSIGQAHSAPTLLGAGLHRCRRQTTVRSSPADAEGAGGSLHQKMRWISAVSRRGNLALPWNRPAFQVVCWRCVEPCAPYQYSRARESKVMARSE